MGASVNTNVGALAALQNLNSTNRALSVTQSRINTGLNVASTKDDSAAFAIAQTLRGDLSGLKAVTSSLSTAKSSVDVAVAGAEQISDLLIQMDAKALEASDTGISDASRASFAKDFAALRAQMTTIIESSSFNGSNLLKGPAATGSSISALQSTTAGATKLSVTNQDFSAVAAAIGDITDADSATAMRATLATQTTAVKDKLSTLGSAARQIDGQMGFVSKLSDAIEGGIGNLVDADLAKESAKLQALQVKQQLGVQALSIANQAPQSVLSLFR